MSDDWQVDDLALCVKRGVWRDKAGTPHNGLARSGGIYTVRRVGFSTSWQERVLWFTDFPGDKWEDSYCACRFRKIKPLTKEEREQFFADLNIREPA